MMPNHRTRLQGIALALALVVAPATTALNAVGAQAAEMAAFTPAALDAAKAAGKPVLVEVTAPWCSTCRAQKPILSKLLADPAYKNLVVFNIDFDSQKAALQTLGVRQQSTLIAYRAGKESARSTGDTDEASIKTLIDKTI